MSDPLITEVVEEVRRRLWSIRKYGGDATPNNREVMKMTDQQLCDRAAELVENALVELALRHGGHLE